MPTTADSRLPTAVRHCRALLQRLLGSALGLGLLTACHGEHLVPGCAGVFIQVVVDETWPSGGNRTCWIVQDPFLPGAAGLADALEKVEGSAFLCAEPVVGERPEVIEALLHLSAPDVMLPLRPAHPSCQAAEPGRPRAFV